MIKPEMPNMGAMGGAFDLMKNMWGSMKMPGMVMPTLSVEEIDKQIKDLKTVEAWMTVNMNMLRGTIQGLEVQSATLAALQTMGNTFHASFSAPPPSAPASAPASSTASSSEPAQSASQGMPDPALWWNVMQEQFNKNMQSMTQAGKAMEGENKVPDTAVNAGASSVEKQSVPEQVAPKKNKPVEKK